MTIYEIGDRVEVTVIAEVTVSDLDGGGRYIEAQSDDGEVSIQLYPHLSSAKIRKLAPPKPEVGDVISGERLKATQWKRGTLFRDTNGQDDLYALRADGDLVNVDAGLRNGNRVFPFSDFRDDEKIKVVYLP